MSRGYLRTDHWTDAVWSLEAAQELAGRVTLDERQWKWLLISVHCAVQGFMALALEQGNALLVMKQEITEKWLKAHEAGTPYPDAKMDFFLSLYEKVKTDSVRGYVHSAKFTASVDHDYSMKKLNELRNGFVHFFPQSWSVQVAGLASVCLKCLEIAHFLGWESNTIIWHDAHLNTRALQAMSALRATLGAVDREVASES